jgi:hypothetical protein
MDPWLASASTLIVSDVCVQKHKSCPARYKLENMLDRHAYLLDIEFFCADNSLKCVRVIVRRVR